MIRLIITIVSTIGGLSAVLHASKPPYTERVYVAERYLIIVAGIINIFAQSIELLQVIMALAKSDMIFKKSADKTMWCMLMPFQMLGLFAMLNLYFVELWKELVPESEIVRGPETSNEQIIHKVYLSTVIIFSVIFWGIIIAMIVAYNLMKKNLLSKQVQLLDGFNSLADQTYDQFKSGSTTECLLCFD